MSKLLDPDLLDTTLFDLSDTIADFDDNDDNFTKLDTAAVLDVVVAVLYVLSVIVAVVFDVAEDTPTDNTGDSLP
ncbi:216_t:CDS:2 [Funneliformis caledonium]|uniref:216_t:CDS:1 n=1 Tax=Funneliformis caledonium TaxID=1117310 RepID=A0A9N9CS99_9GLOM|nr:216_t:CDS:2 [Funneliformis caledonium]